MVVSQGYSLVEVRRLLMAMAALVAECRLWGMRASVLMAHGLGFPVACAIFPWQGSNLCLLHWQADS